MEILVQEFGPDRDQAMAGPLGLFVTVFLVVVVVLLIRGMNKHVRRLNERVDREEAAMRASAETADGPSASAPEADRP